MKFKDDKEKQRDLYLKLKMIEKAGHKIDFKKLKKKSRCN
jgi:hypothetical protein